MNARDPESEWAGFDGTFEGTRRRQELAGLELTPAERLRWLEERMTELLKLKGRAAPPGQAASGKTRV
ncbi:MAG TPA: hypothetical protein VNN08_01430 [Thermoanaerobaculia bacterium]|nr:hypothetical protein [Thermoanaerobaculia bacterium]